MPQDSGEENASCFVLRAKQNAARLTTHALVFRIFCTFRFLRFGILSQGILVFVFGSCSLQFSIRVNLLIRESTAELSSLLFCLLQDMSPMSGLATCSSFLHLCDASASAHCSHTPPRFVLHTATPNHTCIAPTRMPLSVPTPVCRFSRRVCARLRLACAVLPTVWERFSHRF